MNGTFFRKVLLSMLLSMVITFGFTQSENDIRVLAYYLGNSTDLDYYNVNQVTHIIFCFGQLDGNRLTLRKADSVTIQKMVSLKKKNPQLKVILSLGGGRGCKTCSDAFATEDGRKEFARSVQQYHEYFGTDGLDLDWEFPNIEHFPGQKYAPEDKKNFTKLVKELRRLGDQYELSFAAGAHEGIFETVVEWKKVMKYMDYVNLMTYDIGSYQNRPRFPEYRHLSLGSDSKNTAHHTALNSTPDQLHSIPGQYGQFMTPGQERSVDFCVKYLINLGIPREKIIVGAAFYGRVYEQVENLNNGLYQPGKSTGSVAYKNLKVQFPADSGYVYHWDDIAKAPYIYHPSRKIFVTYDDRRSVELKTKYVIDNKLGGIMFWQLRNDSYADGLLDAIDRVKKNYSLSTE